MRERITRALTNGKWEYGYLIQSTPDSFSIDKLEEAGDSWVRYRRHITDTDTISDYIGILDTNGEEIFEGDIVECDDGKFHFKGIIRWDSDNCGYVIETKNKQNIIVIERICDYADCMTVIGNVWEDKNEIWR